MFCDCLFWSGALIWSAQALGDTYLPGTLPFLSHLSSHHPGHQAVHRFGVGRPADQQLTAGRGTCRGREVTTSPHLPVHADTFDPPLPASHPDDRLHPTKPRVSDPTQDLQPPTVVSVGSGPDTVPAWPAFTTEHMLEAHRLKGLLATPHTAGRGGNCLAFAFAK